LDRNIPDNWSTTARRGSPIPASRCLSPSVDELVIGDPNGPHMTDDNNNNDNNNKTKPNTKWKDVYKTGAQFSYNT
jgi:hypothetical protein